MERKKEESLGNVVDRFLAQNGLLTPLLEYRAVKYWSDVVGSSISKHCDEVFFKNGILTVRLKSAALRANLVLNRSHFIHALNEKIGASIVVDLRFI